MKNTTTVFRLVIAAQFPDSFVVRSFNHSGSPFSFLFFCENAFSLLFWLWFGGRGISHFAVSHIGQQTSKNSRAEKAKNDLQKWLSI